jgi:two-component system cell cycle sensor histidine kinase/response regulator CckA
VTGTTPDGGKRTTVLVVDDDAAVRRVAVATLRAEGFIVLEAGDGDSAMKVAAKYGVPVDLLVTDFVMPGMNGRELAHALKPSFPAMRVLYVSGHAQEEAVQKNLLESAFKEGAQFLQKPFLGDALARKVRALLLMG